MLLIYFKLFFLGEIIIELQLSFIKTNWVDKTTFNLHKLRIDMHITSPNNKFPILTLKSIPGSVLPCFCEKMAPYTKSCFAESFSLLKRSFLFILATCMIRMRDGCKVNNSV